MKAKDIPAEVAVEMKKSAASMVSEVNNILRAKLELLLSNKKITVAALQRMTGLGHSHISDWRSNNKNIGRLDSIWRLAHVLGVKLVIK